MSYSDGLYHDIYLARLSAKRAAELERTRDQVVRIEYGSSMISNLERKRLDLLGQLSYVAPSVAVHHDTEVLSLELIARLQTVHEADLRADWRLQLVALEDCLGYTVFLLNLVADTSLMHGGEHNTEGVLSLAASTLCQLSQRDDASRMFHVCRAAQPMVHLLSPLYPAGVVVDVSSAVGNVAFHDSMRIACRVTGCIGALVRLLSHDVHLTVSAAAAVALTQHAARDPAVQDNVRHLGGIEHLVALLAEQDAYVSEAARLCLLSLRQGNSQNQASIMTTLRTSPRAMLYVGASSELLSFTDRKPAGSNRYTASSSHPSHGASVRALVADLDMQSMHSSLSSPTFRIPLHSSTGGALISDLGRQSMHSSLRSPTFKSPLLSSAASLRSSFSSHARISSASGSPPSPLYTSSTYGSPPTSLGTSSASASPSNLSYTSSTYGSPPAAPLTHSAAAFSPPKGSLTPSAESEKSLRALVQAESAVLKKKHLSRFTTEEVVLLLEEMGFDRLDLRGFRVQKIDGYRLLKLSEDELLIDLVLPLSRVDKVKAIQKVTNLFDSIARTAFQGQISEAEVRLYVATHGASSLEVNKIMRLFKTLVETSVNDSVTFWDFATGYDWF
eukprot:gene16279-22460_t